MTEYEAKMTPYDDVTHPENKVDEALRQRPNRDEAEAAVEVLLRWAGDDPSREG